MPTKITELGRLQSLDDGGLVCSVTTCQPPSPDPSICAASLYWTSTSQDELAVGDLVGHLEHGIARYRGLKKLSCDGEEQDFLVLEFAEGAECFVPPRRRHSVRKLGSDYPLSALDAEKNELPKHYCIEALANAYAWPGIGTLPRVPVFEEPSTWAPLGRTREWRREWDRLRKVNEQRWDEAMADWHRACDDYRNALHGNPEYRQAAREYFEKQTREPQPVLSWWVYRTFVMQVELDTRDRDERGLLIKQYVLRRERKAEKLRREVETLENYQNLAGREPIPENVRLFVWRRDDGRCVKCGSRERLEFDHIIPVSAGGSNTERNIQLLCEPCNRAKGAIV